MNSDQLYQEVLLQHSRRPRNHGSVENASHRAEGNNALCGDEISVELRLTGDRIEEVRFQASACAICTASASIMTCEVCGLTRVEATDLSAGFRKLATQGAAPDLVGQRPRLEVMGSVHRFPQRVKCATLPWETLVAALNVGSVTR